MNYSPNHVAIILDGNGRWAQERGFPRYRGHLEGVKRLKQLVRYAPSKGIKFLTIYIFSTENWKRPEKEVSFLLNYFKLFLRKEISNMIKQGVRLLFIGRRDNLSPDIRALIERSEEKTRDGKSLTVVVAFNYGAREEIVSAVRKIVHDCDKQPQMINSFDDTVFEKYLYTAGIPDPDLMIRTSGEQRISNFLLWQISYAELYFTNRYWPDFSEEELDKAVVDYAKRKRRFGGV